MCKMAKASKAFSGIQHVANGRGSPAQRRVFFILGRLNRSDQLLNGPAYQRRHAPVEELEASDGRGPGEQGLRPEPPLGFRDREQRVPLAEVRAEWARARELEQVVQRGVLMGLRRCPVLRSPSRG